MDREGSSSTVKQPSCLSPFSLKKTSLMKANSYVAARASGVASLFLPIRPPHSSSHQDGAGSDNQTMGGETYTYLTMISKYLREGTRELQCAMFRYGTLRCVHYSFLLISNKFCDFDLSLLHWALFRGDSEMWEHYFSPLNTLMRKGKDPDPYL
jgi:hypothetical protein